MAGVTQNISLADLAPMLAEQIEGLAQRTGSLAPAMAEIAGALEDSTRYRFETQTGPDGVAWLPSIRALAEGGQTLTDTGRLRNSITSDSGADWAEIGTNIVYAGIHQFGGEIKHEARQQTIHRRVNQRTGELSRGFVRASQSNFAQDVSVGAYKVEIPARPFLPVSAEDELSIIDILTDHFGGGGAA